MTKKELIVNPGKTEAGQMYLKIKLSENDNISISGVIGPLKSGNCRGGCGQIIDKLSDIVVYNKGWDENTVLKLKALWKKCHLNDLKAGTPEQEDAISMGRAEGNKYEYIAACNYLKSIGLYKVPVKDAQPYSKYKLEKDTYAYGSAWLRFDVAKEDIEELFSFPKSEKEPAWV